MTRKVENDLLLVNPGGRMTVYQALGSALSAIEPPVWAGLIATYARNHGFNVSVLDANAEDLSPEEVADRVEDIHPLLTAVVAYGHNPSASTQVMPAAGAICRAIKDRKADRNVLLLGGHVAALPDRTLLEESVDYVCDGEGPVTVVDLLGALSSPGPDLGKVRGLRYREGGVTRVNGAAPLVMELDMEMAGIAWDLLPMEKYRAHNWHCFGGNPRQPYAAIYTTLGCPHRCSFCCIHAPFKRGEKVLGYKESVNSYRRWSPESVITTIDRLVCDYGVRNIKFADELFVFAPAHVNAICDLIIGRGYDLNIWAYARVDTLPDILLDKIARAGIRWLALGIESASQRVRSDSVKGFPQENIFRAIEKIRARGINIGANYIFGLPEDDHDSMEATLRLALDLNTEWANFNCAMAYPGSQLYSIALEGNWSLPSDWSGFSQYASNTVPLPTRHLSGGDVLRFRDQAFRTYFTNPVYQEMILRKFGEETLSDVQGMVRHTIEREILR
jgi:anaerobic magnesium-protoporphyrin IX monomethyl ester cyclase